MKKSVFTVVILLLIAILCAATGCEKMSQNSSDRNGSVSVGEHQSPYLEVHFIDVGQADAALVLCDGDAMLIDGGDTDDSSTLYTYLRDRGIKELDYVIATHAHEDHVGGISGALHYASAENVLCPVTDFDSEPFESFTKTLDKNDLDIKIPIAGDSFMLGSANVDILACNTFEDANNSSIVLKVTFGETSFLFTADAEYECEQYILDSGYDVSSTVLKVGHHGSFSSTSYRFLNEVMPQYAVISCGKGNDYGHPHTEVLTRLRDADVTVFRTDLSGDIVFRSDGELVALVPDSTSSIPAPKGGRDMVLNTSSLKYHESWCDSTTSINPYNKKDFHGTANEIEALGYSPCGGCH